MSDQWKQKYLDQLDNLEQLEDHREHLRRGMVRLSLLADGLDPSMDESLGSLRKLLRSEDASDQKLLSLLDQIDQQFQVFENQRKSAFTKGEMSLIQATEQLLRLPIESADRKAIKQYRKSIKTLSSSLIQIPELISELVQIQDQILASKKNSRGQRGNWLEKFLGDDGDEELSQMAGSQNESQISYRLSKVINDLLMKIEIPEELTEKTEKIQSLLSENLTWEQLEEILSAVVELVLWVLTEEKNDFEDYLLSINQRLQSFEKIIKDVDAHQLKFNHFQDVFDQSFRQGIETVQQDVKRTTDIQSLKSAVTSQMDQLINAADDFKLQRQQTEQALKAQLDELQQKVTHLQEENKRMADAVSQQRAKAMTDTLTDLPNREAWDIKVSEEYTRFSRYGSPLSLAVADVDFFKKINDSYGHLAGDKVLRVLASTIKKEVRESDFVARYGGEEFVILMPETGIKDAVSAMEKVRAKIANRKFQFEGKPVPITMSFGVSEFQNALNIKEVFSAADQALYNAKNSGRNKVEKA